MTPAEELREAAKRIRKVAQAATPGPWGVGNGTNVCRDVEQLSVGSYTCTQAVTDTDLFDGREEWSDDDPKFVEVDPEDDAQHIALWHPGVAVLVADILTIAAASAEALERQNSREGDGRTRVLPSDLDVVALDLARAILGAVSDAS